MLGLVDSYGRIHDYLRISLTDKCNFNCFYCKPANGSIEQHVRKSLTSDEIIRMVEIFALAGVRKIRLTGGEPLLKEGLPELISRISGIKGIEEIGLTTNGFLLKQNSNKLKRAGLNRLNISLDTMHPKKFIEIAGVNVFSSVLSSINEAIGQDFDELKINVTVIRNTNDTEVLNFIEYFKNFRVTLRFIEFMPFFDNEWDESKYVPSCELIESIEKYYRTEEIIKRLIHWVESKSKAKPSLDNLNSKTGVSMSLIGG